VTWRSLRSTNIARNYKYISVHHICNSILLFTECSYIEPNKGCRQYIY
jgi:hypothetical protein